MEKLCEFLGLSVAFKPTKALDEESLIKTVVSGLRGWKYGLLSSCRQLKQTLNKLLCVQQGSVTVFLGPDRMRCTIDLS